MVLARLTGFVRQDHMAEQQEKTSKWILDGSFKVVDDVRDGLENAAAYFIGMLKGGWLVFCSTEGC